MSQGRGIYNQRKAEVNQSQRSAEVKLDPFLHVNQIIRDKIKDERISHLIAPLGCHAIATILLQPLNVISTLLQLSVKEHKNIYDTTHVNQYGVFQKPAPNSKIESTAVSRINKDITLIQKKKIELQMLSGGKHKPFTAPVYSSYFETIQGLWKQGIRGFFKGGVSTSVLQLYRSSLRYGILNPYIYREKGEVHPYTNLIIAYSALTTIDILLNYVHMVESRFILQSSAPQFSTYRNIKQFVMSQWGMRKWMTVGWKTHFFRNLFVIGANNNNIELVFALNYFIAYPVTTAYKRMLCQSEDAGMIPTRYGSVWHCLKLTLQEEGFRGLYRGFLGNLSREMILFMVFKSIYFGEIWRENSYWLQGVEGFKGQYRP